MSETTATSRPVADFTDREVERYMLDNSNGDLTGPWTWAVFIEVERVVVGATDGVQRTFPTCACGCKGKTIRPEATFLPGHDQRLMGTLQFAHKHDLEVLSQGLGQSALQYGQSVLTVSGVAKLMGYLELVKPVVRNNEPAADAFAAAMGEAPSIEGNETIVVKIGRWEKEAIVTDRDQDGNPFEVQYNDAKGNPVITTKFKIVA